MEVSLPPSIYFKYSLFAMAGKFTKLLKVDVEISMTPTFHVDEMSVRQEKILN